MLLVKGKDSKQKIEELFHGKGASGHSSVDELLAKLEHKQGRLETYAPDESDNPLKYAVAPEFEHLLEDIGFAYLGTCDIEPSTPFLFANYYARSNIRPCGNDQSFLTRELVRLGLSKPALRHDQYVHFMYGKDTAIFTTAPPLLWKGTGDNNAMSAEHALQEAHSGMGNATFNEEEISAGSSRARFLAVGDQVKRYFEAEYARKRATSQPSVPEPSTSSQ